MTRRPLVRWFVFAPLLAPHAAAQCELDPLGAKGSETWFGGAVSLSKHWAIVGARSDSTLAPNAGAATIYARDGEDFTFVTTLLASDGGEDHNFGQSVWIGDELAIVGAPGGYPTGDLEGAVYVFEHGESGWAEVQKLGASNPVEGGQFGWSLAVSGDRMLVGTGGELGIEGRAYVLEHGPSGWFETAQLVAANVTYPPLYGYSVALSGETAFVGNPLEAEPVQNAGGAFVFELGQDGWEEVQKLAADDPQAHDPQAAIHFGIALAVEGDRALVAAHGYSDYAGALFAFERSGQSWVQVQTLFPEGGQAEDAFGTDVVIDREGALVGAPGPGYATTIQGAAIYFEHSGAGWVELGRLANPVVDPDHNFGDAVALYAGHALVGAPGALADYAGAVHSFRATVGRGYCTSVPNSTGLGAIVHGVGSCAASDNQLDLTAAHLPPDQLGYFLASRSRGFVPGPGGSGGNLCLGAPIARLVSGAAHSSPEGELHDSIDLTDLDQLGAAMAGETLRFQCWFRDVGGTSNFTNGYEIPFL